ncbi:MAG: DUF6328 family protein [Acidimicrobiales bacterium]
MTERSLAWPGGLHDPQVDDGHVDDRHVDDRHDDDRSSGDLDDHADREELRRRYYGLMQELRVLLPGAQVLVAFLLTAPFANRFGELDRLGTTLYLAALLSGMSAVVFFVTPTAVHRFGRRQARRRRLADAIVVTRVGIVLLGLSLLTAEAVIVRMVAGGAVALALTTATAVLLAVLWVLVPLRTRRP